MVRFPRKPSSSMMLIWTVFLSFIITVHGQYPPGPYNGPSPYRSPMAFSPYHPARINHETLPISQAEFAQLVAESMATSRGPHHHHPPNTDADYEGPDHWSKESTPSASSAPVPKSLHPNHAHVHPANRQYPANEPSAARQPDQSSALYHQQLRSQSSMSMAHPHHMRQYSPYSSVRTPSPYNHNQYHPSDVESSHDDDYRREPPAHHPSQSMQYQPEESRFTTSDDDNDDQYGRSPVYETAAFGPQPETSGEDEPDPHTYGGRPSSHDDYSNGAQPASYHANHPQRHPGQMENGPSQIPQQPMHDYQNERVHPMTAAMLHQHQSSSQSVGPEPMAGPSPIGPQPMYRPNDPSSLAYHQDFSKQMNRANYHQSASSTPTVSSPVHPFASHGYPTTGGYGHPRPMHPSAPMHSQRMQMYGDGSNHQANYYNGHHAASYAHHHQHHPHAYPRRPEDMYMAASSETDSLVDVPGTDTIDTVDHKPTETAATSDKPE